MSDITVVYVILAGAVVLFVTNRVAVELVAIGVSLALLATGVLDADQALSGFGDPTVIFIASLFVVSEGLDLTGVTTWAGQQLMRSVGASRTRLIVMMMLLVAGLTALISVNGAVSALIPVIVVIALRLGCPPSQLLMPLAFAAHAGSMLALTGTPVNIIVSDAARDTGADGFGFFEFTIVGVPLLIGVITIAVLFGERLLPNRTADALPPDLSRYAADLQEHYAIDPSVNRLRVTASSPLVGRPASAIDSDGGADVSIVGVQSLDHDDPIGRTTCSTPTTSSSSAGRAPTSNAWRPTSRSSSTPAPTYRTPPNCRCATASRKWSSRHGRISPVSPCSPA